MSQHDPDAIVIYQDVVDDALLTLLDDEEILHLRMIALELEPKPEPRVYDAQKKKRLFSMR